MRTYTFDTHHLHIANAIAEHRRDQFVGVRQRKDLSSLYRQSQTAIATEAPLKAIPSAIAHKAGRQFPRSTLSGNPTRQPVAFVNPLNVFAVTLVHVSGRPSSLLMLSATFHA